MESEPALTGVRMGAAGEGVRRCSGRRGGVAGGVEAIVPSADIWTEAISTGGGMASSSSRRQELVTASERSTYHKYAKAQEARIPRHMTQRPWAIKAVSQGLNRVASPSCVEWRRPSVATPGMSLAMNDETATAA